jgi:FKBP-type peptidyl-prolyl cis-trans isomerase FkpA
MKKLTISAIAMTLCVQGCVTFNDTINKAAKEKGAVKTFSGMVFRSIRDGNGKSPIATSFVEVNYRGTLSDGSEFDSNDNSRFKLTKVIPCWTEGLQMMKVGGKAQLVCPPELAYGRKGSGSEIPPDATLIFEVELLGIK